MDIEASFKKIVDELGAQSAVLLVTTRPGCHSVVRYGQLSDRFYMIACEMRDMQRLIDEQAMRGEVTVDPAEVWQATRGMKILGPWEKDPNDADVILRCDLAGSPFVRVLQISQGVYSWVVARPRCPEVASGGCRNLEEAMQLADVWLRSEGWSLA